MKRDAQASPAASGFSGIEIFEGNGSQSAPACSPWHAASKDPARQGLRGRVPSSGAMSGPASFGIVPISSPGPLAVVPTGLTPPSRAAVTDATSSRRLDPEPSMPGRGSSAARSPVIMSAAEREQRTCAYGERVDGARGAQSHEVCWPGAARHADLVATFPPASHNTTAPRTTDHPSSATELHRTATAR